MLHSKTSHSLRGCSAVTDTFGVAKISTTVRTKIAPGAVQGDYVVVLSKSAELPNELIPTEEEQTFSQKIRADLQVKREVFLEKNRIIPKILEDSATSPIELTVTEKNSTKLTIDIAKYF
jgi:hydrogenase maturation factor